MIRIWLDDLRTMPEGFTHWARTASEAIDLLRTGTVDEISFDHDLGPEEAGSGYDVAKFIEEQAHLGKLKPMNWHIHSANPVGRANIEAAMKSAEYFWEKL